MWLTQSEEGKGTPELTQRMSRKGKEVGKAEKQITEYCCLLDTTFLTRGPFWLLWVTLLRIIWNCTLSLKPYIRGTLNVSPASPRKCMNPQAQSCQLYCNKSTFHVIFLAEHSLIILYATHRYPRKTWKSWVTFLSWQQGCNYFTWLTLEKNTVDFN